MELNPEARERLAAAGISPTEWARRNFQTEQRFGDACGCFDDRCIGHHHDVDDACGCLSALLEQEGELVMSHADRPLVVCLCGSTRFMDAIAHVAQLETLAGRIVVRPEVVSSTRSSEGVVLDTEAKTALDRLHRAKIRLADEVVFVAPGGYMGPSTRAELAYALDLGKPIRMVPDSMEDR
ncbi:hypothetical protein AB0F91_42575 [Amycolatopsis sp. NPDC023774]|uniref:hypothetical protein n=1 Tax=Amycolatopsis sp. NPDC023774 TaxID=3155015 RepID=UPI0033C24A80